MTPNPMLQKKRGRRTVIGLCAHKTALNLKDQEITKLQEKLTDEIECVDMLKKLVDKNNAEINRLNEAVHDKDELLNGKDAEIKQLESMRDEANANLRTYVAECRRLNLIINRLVGFVNE